MHEVLVAILNDPAAFALVQNQGWYRVPVDTAPKRWPPDVLAFYIHIAAERQWCVKIGRVTYFLDFALFCQQGRIAVETDGLLHTEPKRVVRDYERENALQLDGWEVLRFSGTHVREELESYCVPEIVTMIGQLGGLSQEHLPAPGPFVYPDPKPERWIIGEASPDYDWD